MSDRARPRGPKSAATSRDFQSNRSSYVPQRDNRNRDNYERSSYVPSQPRGGTNNPKQQPAPPPQHQQQRDSYRANNNRNGPPSGPRNPSQQRASQPKPQHQQRDSKSSNNSNNKSSSGNNSNNSYKQGSKRQLPPSGPSSHSKRRQFGDQQGYRKTPTSAPAFRDKPYISVPKGPRFHDEDEVNRHQPSTLSPSPAPASGPVSGSASTKLFPDQIYCIKIAKGAPAYERVQQVGEGTYGKVYKAKNSITGEFVALKKLRLEQEREGFPITAIREIKLLQSFDHVNVVGLLEMMVEHNQIFMIFDYLDHDLTGLLTHPELHLEESHRKCIFKQLMTGLDYLHGKRIIHRDIKGSNILLDASGNLKIADFGLARTMTVLGEGEVADFTNRVITIWYRPPELLLGATNYGREVDIWGVGCLLIELYSRMAAFRGMDEISQLGKIFNIMGTPTHEQWPQIDKLPWFEMLKPKINIASKFSSKYQEVMSPDAFKLAGKLLSLNPEHRPSAEEALRDVYFSNDPQPRPLTFLRELQGEWHEFETKKRRREERKRVKDEEDAELAASKKKVKVDGGPAAIASAGGNGGAGSTRTSPEAISMSTGVDSSKI
ncbi:uncharacterized protein LODBEIA_P34150 [Lodderomyces beijingensis]|uniref:Protein kinase domain-containing protein n=1 Tax=Lodderomyces beijingensis TaxID=1775926 RepID=A0ABP0ZM05_9ASCO